jgi:hypothetical protein
LSSVFSWILEDLEWEDVSNKEEKMQPRERLDAKKHTGMQKMEGVKKKHVNEDKCASSVP